MPAFVLLEALAQSAGILCYFSGLLKDEHSIAFLAGVTNCRFGIAPKAGDQVVLDCVLTRAIRNIARIYGRGLIGAEVAVAADLTIAIIRA